MAYIVIDTNSDLDPISYPVDSDEEIEVARAALKDAGLAYEDIWAGAIDCPDSYRTDGKLFAAK